MLLQEETHSVYIVVLTVININSILIDKNESSMRLKVMMLLPQLGNGVQAFKMEFQRIFSSVTLKDNG